ncbi:MAG: helix-turn-helix domain-containing protein, partial [bacterium]
MASFPERMKQLRKEKGISLEKLSDKIGTTKSTLSRYENNKREPKIHIAQKIADEFNVSVDFLLGRTNERLPAHELKETMAKDP